MHLEANTRLIPLSRGLWTLVDAADYPLLSAWKWSARQREPGSVKFDAVRGVGSSRRPGHKIIRMHRQLLGCGEGNGVEVDHMNGDSLDNRRSNLRISTRLENAKNRGASKRNTSGYCGVSFDIQRDKWKAAIMAGRHHHYLGRFATAEEAARAYDTAAIQLHGEFAQLNFPH